MNLRNYELPFARNKECYSVNIYVLLYYCLNLKSFNLYQQKANYNKKSDSQYICNPCMQCQNVNAVMATHLLYLTT